MNTGSTSDSDRAYTWLVRHTCLDHVNGHIFLYAEEHGCLDTEGKQFGTAQMTATSYWQDQTTIDGGNHTE